MERNRYVVLSLAILHFILVIGLVWKHFLSITEILTLLVLYVTISGIISYYLRNNKIKSIAEYTLSIIVDGYVGIRIIQSIRPYDRSSIYLWMLFIVFAYLIGIRRLMVRSRDQVGEEK